MKNVIALMVFVVLGASQSARAEVSTPMGSPMRSPGFTNPGGFSQGFHTPGHVVAVPRPGTVTHVVPMPYPVPYRGHYYPMYRQMWRSYWFAYANWMGMYYGGYGRGFGRRCFRCGPRKVFNLGIAIGGFRLNIHKVKW